MKISLLSDRIPPENVGGAGKVAWSLAIGLHQAGHDVSVIAATPGKSFEAVREGIPTYHIHAHYPARWQSWQSLYNPQTVNALRDLFRRIRPDVINGHNIHRDLSYASFSVAHSLGIPAVFSSHDVMPFAYTKLSHFIDPHQCGVKSPEQYRLPRFFNARQMRLRYNPFRNLIIQRILQQDVQARVCVSEAHRQCLEANGLPPFRVIYNGLDPAPFEHVPMDRINARRTQLQLAGRRVILFGGRLSLAKGSAQLLAALKIAARAVPAVTLLTLSPTPLISPEPAYDALFADHVRSGGWLSGADLAAAYRLADIVTVPSIIMDCFPMINLEAMAAGKPLVSTCYGGSSEAVIDGETGYIVNPFDTEIFAARLIELLRDPTRCEQMGAAGAQRLRDQFTLREQVEKTLAVYGEIV